MARVILTGSGLLSLLLAGRCLGHCPVAPYMRPCCSNCLGLLVAWVTLTDSGLLTRRTARRLGLCPLAPVVAFLRNGLCPCMASVTFTGIGLHTVFRTGGFLRHLSVVPVVTACTRVGNSPSLHCKVQCDIDQGATNSISFNYILICYYSAVFRIPYYFSIFDSCTFYMKHLIGSDMRINRKTCRRIRYFHRSALRAPTRYHT